MNYQFNPPSVRSDGYFTIDDFSALFDPDNSQAILPMSTPQISAKMPTNHPTTKPKRPLTAYNIFFKHQRGILLGNIPNRQEGKPRRSHGKIGFADLARTIADRWSKIDPKEREYLETLAVENKKRYHLDMKDWKEAQAHLMDASNHDGAIGSGSLSSVNCIFVCQSMLRAPPNDSLHGLLLSAQRLQRSPSPVMSNNPPTPMMHSSSTVKSCAPLARHQSMDDEPLYHFDDMASQLDDESIDCILSIFL